VHSTKKRTLGPRRHEKAHSGCGTAPGRHPWPAQNAWSGRNV